MNPKPKILIVDDVEANLKVLSVSLTKKNMTVFTAISGEEALKMVDEYKPDVVLLDIAMPGMDGFEVCEQLKNHPEHQSIPIVFLSAKTEAEDIMKGFDLGAADYIVKPFSSEDVYSRLMVQVKLKKAYDEIRAKDKEITLLKAKIKKLEEAN